MRTLKVTLLVALVAAGCGGQGAATTTLPASTSSTLTGSTTSPPIEAVPGEQGGFGFDHQLVLSPPPGRYRLVKHAVEAAVPDPARGTVSGTLTLTALAQHIRIGPLGTCEGVGDAADIAPGMKITVRKPNTPGGGIRQVVGVLGGGVLIGETAATLTCQFTFTVSRVGNGWDTVEVRAGDSWRGTVTYTLDEVATAGWAIALGVEQP